MNRCWLVCSLTGILFAAAVPALCQSPYATDLGITRYAIHLEPHFADNGVSCRVRALVRNFSSRTIRTVEIDLRSGANALDHEMTSITVEADGRKEPVDVTVSRRNAEGAAPGRPAYAIPLKKDLNAGESIWVEFDYELQAKPPQGGFPIFETAGVKELYLMSDYQWLPRISHRAPPNVFSNTCRPAWTLTVAYPASYTSMVDGEIVRRAEAGGLRTEEWKSVAGVLPQVFIAPYDLIRVEKNGLKLEMAVARENGLKSQAASVVDDVFKMLGLYGRLFGMPGGSTYRLVVTYTRNGAHGLHMGNVVDPGYLQPVDLESIAHEISHTWWGSSVSSYNEGSKFLRESLAGFSAAWAMRELRGPAYFRNSLLRFKANTFFMYPARSAEMKQYPVIEQPGYETGGIVSASYRKGPLVLDELRRELGDSLFFACLGQFGRKYRDRNATMADFVQTFNVTSKKSLDARFKELCWNAGAASYELTGFTSVPRGNHFVTTVRLRNAGGMAVRCPVLLAMRDGEQRDDLSCAPGTETELHFETPTEVVRVVLDPDLDAFQYRPEQRYPAWARLDDSTFAGNNWAWFNKSYALYRMGMTSEAVRTLTTYLDGFMATSGVAGIRELGRDPVRACYLFARGLYHHQQHEGDLAEADIKASIPGLASFLLKKAPIAAVTFAGIVEEKTPEKDLASLVSFLTGKELSLDSPASDEATQRAIESWLKWWDEQGSAVKLNLKALDRYPAGRSNE